MRLNVIAAVLAATIARTTKARFQGRTLPPVAARYAMRAKGRAKTVCGKATRDRYRWRRLKEVGDRKPLAMEATRVAILP